MYLIIEFFPRVFFFKSANNLIRNSRSATTHVDHIRKAFEIPLVVNWFVIFYHQFVCLSPSCKQTMARLLQPLWVRLRDKSRRKPPKIIDTEKWPWRSKQRSKTVQTAFHYNGLSDSPIIYRLVIDLNVVNGIRAGRLLDELNHSLIRELMCLTLVRSARWWKGMFNCLVY